MNTKKNKKCIKNTQYEIKENTKYFVKNRLPAFILAGFMIFWTIASILGIVAYSRSDRTAKSNVIMASAQTVQEYENRELIIELPAFDGLYFQNVNNGNNLLNTNKFQLRFPLISQNYEVYNQLLVNGIAYDFDIDTADTIVDVGFFDDTSLLTNIDTTFVWGSTDSTVTPFDNLFRDWSDIKVEYYLGGYTDHFYVAVYVYFTQNVYGPAPSFTLQETITETVNFTVDFNLSWGNFSRFVCPLYDVLSNSFQPQVEVRTLAYGFPTADYLDLRYRYTVIYNNYNSSFQNGYSEGYNAGNTLGYERGYQDGVNSQEYTFDGLLSAVFDVPVRTFTSLFNFEILGINLSNFFLSLLTLAFMLAILKLLI